MHGADFWLGTDEIPEKHQTVIFLQHLLWIVVALIDQLELFLKMVTGTLMPAF